MTARTFRDVARDLRSARGAIAQQRTAADRLSGLAIEYLRAGAHDKAKEAARYADLCLRSAIAERDDPDPRGMA